MAVLGRYNEVEVVGQASVLWWIVTWHAYRVEARHHHRVLVNGQVLCRDRPEQRLSLWLVSFVVWPGVTKCLLWILIRVRGHT